jgi:S-DNA-T family DNA segregation ATPase FtsK/SpoIIIE
MATKKKKEKEPFFDDLAPHTKQAIGAIGFGVLGIFFVLSSLHTAGSAGNITHTVISYLFGVGFVLAPLACLLYVVVLLRPRENGRTSMSKMLGVTLLTFSVLGLIALYNPEDGGMIGRMLMIPLTYLFGTLTTGIVLGGTTLIALLLTLNTGIKLPSFFKQKEHAPTETPEIAIQNPIPSELLEEDDTEESDESEKPERKTLKERVLGKPEFFVEHFRGPYAPPPLSLVERDKGKARVGDVKASANIIKRTLEKFGILVEMDEVSIGPSVTRYALKPAEGVRVSKIVSLQSNLELALAASPVRIEAPIPGKSLVGIEVPNTQKSMVGMGSLLSSAEFTDSPKPLLVALGKDIAGVSHFKDVAKMPHLLIAGTTGSGKSATIHALITSLLFRNSPEQLRFIMVDPKRVELTLYNGIPHLLTPVITDAKKSILSLKWAAKEMERRYEILQTEKVRDIGSYHDTIYKPALKKFDAKKASKGGVTPEDEKELPVALPYIVIIVDELADIMQTYPRELEASIVRLAQMSRAVGIHLILSTQRPEVKVITGLIKANVPGRIALKVNSQIDSRVIIDSPGAEKLLGQGDMLYLSGEVSKPLRIQSAYISEGEVKAVVEYLKGQSDAHSLDSIDLEGGAGEHSDALFESMVDDDNEDDELYEEAKSIVIKDKKASTSYLQRRLRVGYSRAARLIDILEERGVIGAQDGARPREIFGSPESEERPL